MLEGRLESAALFPAKANGIPVKRRLMRPKQGVQIPTVADDLRDSPLFDDWPLLFIRLL